MNTSCKNCDNVFEGNYCPQCGQSAQIQAINAHYFLHDIPHSVFHVDKGLPYTLKALFTHPGKMLKEYLAGKRVKHFRPFAYVVIMSTLCTLLIRWIEILMVKIYTAKHEEAAVAINASFFSKYISILIFILIPILALVTWFWFRNQPYNYWEHFLANTYLTAQLNIILLLIKLYALIKLLITGEFAAVNFSFFMFLFMAYYAHTFVGWMHPLKPWWKGVLRITAMNFCLASIYMTAFSLVGIMTPWWRFN